MMSRTIDIVTAVIRDPAGRMLVVRKRGSAMFMKPGGKRETGEDDLTALARELDEELGCRLVSARLLGDFEARPPTNRASPCGRPPIWPWSKARSRCGPRSRNWPGSTRPLRTTFPWRR
jgi:8-oxo-dGTP pyrophosphatase MutT (NUDIX family)